MNDTLYQDIEIYILEHQYEAFECMMLASPIEDILEEQEETFSEMVIRIIDESHLKDADVYKKANIDRKLYSKIRSNKDYNPSKQTAIALGIALQLPLDVFDDLLEKAGFTLSHSNKRDLIVEYFITNGNYDLSIINEALLEFKQKPIRI